MHVACGRVWPGPVLLCSGGVVMDYVYYTSGFIDEVMCSHNGPYGVSCVCLLTRQRFQLTTIAIQTQPSARCSMTVSAQHRVSVLLDFGRRQLDRHASGTAHLGSVTAETTANHIRSAIKPIVTYTRRELRTGAEVCYLQLPCYIFFYRATLF